MLISNNITFKKPLQNQPENLCIKDNTIQNNYTLQIKIF